MSQPNFAQALPGEFSFYHLGTVRNADATVSRLPQSLSAEGLKAVAFSLYGEVRGLAVAIFARDSDESMFIELGNTLASRLGDALATTQGMVMISPPMSLSATQYASLQAQSEPLVRVYSIPQGDLCLAVFPSPTLKEDWND